mgnify:CR=1 FL=1
MLNSYTWYKKDIPIDSADSIHNTFKYGTLKDIKDLINQAGKEKVISVFLEVPKKHYSDASLHFISSYVLGIDELLNKDRYLSYAPRNTR